MPSSAARKPAVNEAVTPPAAAVKPPVSAPTRPLCATESITPWASRCPKPMSGTVAPAPAKSASGSYQPSALSVSIHVE